MKTTTKLTDMKTTTTKVILGMTIAAAAGAAIGMLLAPEKGTDLQKKLANSAKDWLAEFSSLLTMGKEVVEDVKAKGEETVESFSSEINKIGAKS